MKLKSYLWILTLVLIFLVLCATVNVCAVDTVSADKYKEAIYSILGIDESKEISEEWVYREIFEYRFDDSALDEATPDYVVVSVNKNMCLMAESAGIFGDYVIRSNDTPLPSPYYHIYVPDTNRLYTLPEACDSELRDIDKVIARCSGAQRIGDVDYDGAVTIKDATLIQKQLAGLERIKNDEICGLLYYTEFARYISDFDRDGNRTVRDATAIQKYLVGLEF